MELALAEKIAREAMDQWGLTAQGWEFRWSRAVKQLGETVWQTDGSPGYIALSRKPVELNSEDVIRNTILHEIAHALAGNSAGHGPLWKAWCRTTGAIPERESAEAEHVRLRYVGTCPNGHETYRARRVTAKTPRQSCAQCNPKRYDERYLFTWKDTKA